MNEQKFTVIQRGIHVYYEWVGSGHNIISQELDFWDVFSKNTREH